MKRLHVFAAIACLSLVVPVLVHAQGDATGKARVGTWKLNLSKSKIDPGSPTTYQSETRIYTDAGAQGIKTTATITGTDGKTTTRSYTSHYDGKDAPYTSNPVVDTINIKSVDINTADSVGKKDGKVMQNSHSVLSAGGKVLTITTTGTTPQGQKYTNVMVYDKQ